MTIQRFYKRYICAYAFARMNKYFSSIWSPIHLELLPHGIVGFIMVDVRCACVCLSVKKFLSHNTCAWYPFHSRVTHTLTRQMDTLQIEPFCYMSRVFFCAWRNFTFRSLNFFSPFHFACFLRNSLGSCFYFCTALHSEYFYIQFFLLPSIRFDGVVQIAYGWTQSCNYFWQSLCAFFVLCAAFTFNIPPCELCFIFWTRTHFAENCSTLIHCGFNYLHASGVRGWERKRWIHIFSVFFFCCTPSSCQWTFYERSKHKRRRFFLCTIFKRHDIYLGDGQN